MPYAAQHRLQKDAERKRIARATGPSKSQRRFEDWFKDCVKKIPSSEDKRAWSVRLAEAIAEGESEVRSDETDRTLRRYYDGETKRPRPHSAYKIGWGFHNLGIDWCSGPLGLLAGGFTLQFFEVLALLSSGSNKGREAALRFAFASFAALEPVTAGFRRHRSYRRHEARTNVAEAANERTDIDMAWETLGHGARAPRAAMKTVLPDFHLAVDIVGLKYCSEAVRVFGALAILEKGAAERDTDDSQLIQNLRWLSIGRLPKNGGQVA